MSKPQKTSKTAAKKKTATMGHVKAEKRNAIINGIPVEVTVMGRAMIVGRQHSHSIGASYINGKTVRVAQGAT